METKRLAFDACEVKFDASGKAGVIEGYASVFGGVDSYGDMVMAGAYADTLKNRARPVRMRWNHFGPVIGKWTSMEEDGKGLLVRGEITPGHSVAQDVLASMRHGSVDGLSIGYRIPSGGSAKDGKVRLLKRIDLIEVSVVEDPADLGAKIADVKSAIDECASFKDIENLLREAAGFSRADASGLVARIKALSHGEREANPEHGERGTGNAFDPSRIVSLIQRINIPNL